MKRPLWTVGISFALGLFLAAVLEVHIGFICGIVCGVSALFAVCLSDWRRTAVPTVLFALAAAFALSAIQFYRVALPATALHNSTVTVEATVSKVTADYYTASVTGGTLPAGALLTVYTDNTDTVEIGSLVSGECYIFANTRSFQNPSMVYTADPLTIRAGTGIRYSLSLWRNRLTAVFAPAGDTIRSVLSALCLGDYRGLSDDIEWAFRRSGTSHILSVSGFHMSIIASAVLMLLRRTRLSPRACPLLAMAVVLLYMALTGFHYAVIRSGVMQLFFLCGECIRRESDGRNSLGGALLFILLSDITAVYDVGLWLSAFATAGLVIAYPACHTHLTARSESLTRFPLLQSVLRKTADALCITLIAVVAVLPVQLLVFRECTWISLFSNLLCVPLSTPIVILGCITALCGIIPLLSWLSLPLLWITTALTTALIRVAEWFTHIPHTFLSFDSNYAVAWVIGSLLLCALGWQLYRKRGLVAALISSGGALLCGVLVTAFLTSGLSTIQLLPAYHTTSMLITADAQQHLVYTAADSADADAVARRVSACGVDTLDTLILPAEADSTAVTQLFTEQSIHIRTVVILSNNRVTDVSPSVRMVARDGWIRLCCGDTRMVYASAHGDAATLPQDWRETDMVVFDGTPPLHATALNASQGIWCCHGDTAAAKALPWGVYPLYTATDTVTVYTRGDGDIYRKD